MDNFSGRYDKGLNSRKIWYNPNKFNPTDSAFIYILFLAGFLGVSYAFVYVYRFLISAGISDTAVLMCVSAVVSQLFILLLALIYSALLKVNSVSGGGFVFKPNITNVFYSALLVFGLLVLLLPVTERFVDSVGYLAGGRTGGINLEGSDEGAILLYVLVLSTVLPAICEEILFRGVILKGLLPMGKTAAVILSSAMFALGHGSFMQMLYQFFIGVAIGAVYVMTKDLFVAMFMHFFNNLAASLYTVFLEVLKEQSTQLYHFGLAISIIIGAVALVVGAVYFLNYIKRGTVEKEPKRRELKSCMTFDLNEESTILKYDTNVRYSTAAEKVYFTLDGRKFIPMRKKSNNNISMLYILLGVIGATALIFLDFFSIF